MSAKPRLTFSSSAQIRASQISSVGTIVIVEGRRDQQLISNSLQSIKAPWLGKFQVKQIQEVEGTGGKPTLLNCFRERRKRRTLVTFGLGVRTTYFFLADKDVDDLLRKTLRSPHLVYTPTYDIEGLLLSSRDLCIALSAALECPEVDVRDAIPSTQDLLTGICERWSEWIALCVLSQKHGIDAGCGFSRPTQVNGADRLGEALDALVNSYLGQLDARIRAKSNAAAAINVRPSFEKFVRKLRVSARSAEPLRYVKGKDVAPVFLAAAKASLAGRSACSLASPSQGAFLAALAASSSSQCRIKALLESSMGNPPFFSCRQKWS